MKLYYTPNSCGASSFIYAFISKLSFDCETVDLSTHTTESGVDFYTINPKGNVPALVLDNGTVLNENISCLEYIADQTNDISLNDKYVILQLLSFLASELHSSIGLFFNPKSKDPLIRDFVQSVFDKKMDYLQKNILSENSLYAYGNRFTAVDSYLHIILSWTTYVGIDLAKYPVANTYYNNICNLEEVKNAKNRIATKPSTTY